MVDVAKLKKRIIEKNTTQESLALSIGIDRSTLHRKLKSNGESFTVGEVRKIAAELSLLDQEVFEIFLTHKSHK